MLTQNAFESSLRQLLSADMEPPPLLAVSGGVDSVVLLQLYACTGRPGIVVHCNFQLRGAASDGDEQWVRELAAQLGFPFLSITFDTKEYAQREGVSIQMAARTLRYNWFSTLQKEGKAGGVITAHHLNDSVETFLINASRSTGLRGLTGIAPLSERDNRGLTIWRPLLKFSRAQIEACALIAQWTWREDESNAKDDYLRNYLRHHVVPAWQQAQPALLSSMSHSMQLLRETEANYRFLLQKLLPLKVAGQGRHSIDIATLMTLPSPAPALWELLRDYGFDAEQTRQMVACADKPGTIFESEQGARLLIDRRSYFLELASTGVIPPPVLIEQDDLMVRLPDGGRIMLIPVPQGSPFPDGKLHILVDKGRLKYPVSVRNWQPGDVFQPLGMNGKRRKLQDFFTDLKMNRFEKEQIKLLVNGDNEIVWIMGIRPDERFKVVPESTDLVKISWIPPDAVRN